MGETIDQGPIQYLEKAMTAALETGEVPSSGELRDVLGHITEDRYGGYGSWKDSVLRHEVRDWFISNYSFALPCQHAIRKIASFGPVLEVGAGSGFWAKLLSHRVAVVATDIDKAKNSYGQPVGKWYPVQHMDSATAVRRYPNYTVFMVWPPYNEVMAYEAIREMKRGQHLCYIGEGYGGCTGDDQFHNMICRTDMFEEVADIHIPQFYGLHDDLYIYRRL